MAADAALFSHREKCEKPLHQPHLQHQEIEKKRLLNHGQGGNLEDRHEELECQRSVPQSAAKTKNRKRPSALPPAVLPAVAHDTSVAGMSSREILGTSITCSATGHSVLKKRRTSTSCSPISSTGTSRIGSAGAVSTIWSTGCC